MINSMAEETELGNLIWTDAGSGGTYDGAVWDIKDWFGMRVGRGSGDRPSFLNYKLAAFTGALYRDMVMVLEISNPTDKEASASHKLTRGMTFTSGSSATHSAEFGIEVTAKASAGVAGIASTEMATKITSKFGASTTFSSADTSTQKTEVTIQFGVPPMSKVQLYQLIVTDSKTGRGDFMIHSAKYTILRQRL